MGVKLYVGHSGDPCPTIPKDRSSGNPTSLEDHGAPKHLCELLNLNAHELLDSLLHGMAGNIIDNPNLMSHGVSMKAPNSILTRLRAAVEVAELQAAAVKALASSETAIAETEGPTFLPNESSTHDIPLSETMDEETWEDEAEKDLQKSLSPRVLP